MTHVIAISIQSDGHWQVELWFVAISFTSFAVPIVDLLRQRTIDCIFVMEQQWFDAAYLCIKMWFNFWYKKKINKLKSTKITVCKQMQIT